MPWVRSSACRTWQFSLTGPPAGVAQGRQQRVQASSPASSSTSEGCGIAAAVAVGSYKALHLFFAVAGFTCTDVPRIPGMRSGGIDVTGTGARPHRDLLRLHRGPR